MHVDLNSQRLEVIAMVTDILWLEPSRYTGVALVGVFAL
jgi:hypothetical protein